MIEIKLNKIKLLAEFDMDRYKMVGVQFVKDYDGYNNNTSDRIYFYRCLRSKEVGEGHLVLVPVRSERNYALAKVTVPDIENIEEHLRNKSLIQGVYDSAITVLEHNGELRPVVYDLGKENAGQFKEYKEELERESQIKEIKAQLKKRAESARELSLYTALAQHDPAMQSLLEQLSDITGDNLLLGDGNDE